MYVCTQIIFITGHKCLQAHSTYTCRDDRQITYMYDKVNMCARIYGHMAEWGKKIQNTAIPMKISINMALLQTSNLSPHALPQGKKPHNTFIEKASRDSLNLPICSSIPEFLDQQQHIVSTVDHQKHEKQQGPLRLSRFLGNN